MSEGIIKKVKGDDAKHRLAKQRQRMANHRARERLAYQQVIHYWLAKSPNSSSSGDLSLFLDIFISPVKLQSSNCRLLDSHIMLSKRATLHPHVHTLTQLAT